MNSRREDRYDLVVIGAGSAGLVAEATLGRSGRPSARVYSFETPEQLAKRGIAVEQGQARFLDHHSVAVAGRRIQGRSFVICAGAVPQRPTLAGLDAVPYLTYEEVFELDQLPDRLLVLGGGPVGVELAQAFARLGSKVTLIEKESRLLSAADPEAGDILARVLAAEGVAIETCFEVVEARAAGGEIVLSSARESFAGDRLLVATGRRPDVEGLDLERAGVEFDERGVRVRDVSERLRQTSAAAAPLRQPPASRSATPSTRPSRPSPNASCKVHELSGRGSRSTMKRMSPPGSELPACLTALTKVFAKRTWQPPAMPASCMT